MKDDRDRVMDVRQSALWLGCPASFILKLKRWGWIRAIEDIPEVKPTRSVRCHFYLWQLEVLAWDIAYSLSFYDIVALRSNRIDVKRFAKQRGIPTRVVRLVQEAYVFGWVTLLARRYSARRDKNKIKRADVELPFPPCPLTLPGMMAELSARDRAACYLGFSSPEGKPVAKASPSLDGHGTPPELRILPRRGRGARKRLDASLAWEMKQAMSVQSEEF